MAAPCAQLLGRRHRSESHTRSLSATANRHSIKLASTKSTESGWPCKAPRLISACIFRYVKSSAHIPRPTEDPEIRIIDGAKVRATRAALPSVAETDQLAEW